MEAVYEYCLFVLICTSVIREVLSPLSAAHVWLVEVTDPLALHQVWLEHLSSARQENLLGPLRLEHRDGGWCVVGVGESRPVASMEEGIALIRQLKSQIGELFTTGLQDESTKMNHRDTEAQRR